MVDTSTIIALATPLGQAPLAILRVSGPKTFEITKKLFISSKDFQKSEGFEIFLGYIRNPKTGVDIDQVLLSVFKSPRSFTGEDMVEISCHGGMVVFQEILDLYLSLGATLAPRGEFSKRAFFNGKMDLTQAEAIHDLIFSRSTKTAETALRSLKKNFFQILQNIKQKLLVLVSKVEVSIDYSEEYSHTLGEEDKEVLSRILEELSSLSHQAQNLKEQNKGYIIAIIGEPNAGKSSLLNALVGENKAIVSHIAGTTRDPIEVSMVYKGSPLTLIDTAGLREDTKDDIERQGIEKSQEVMLLSDFSLLVVDSTQFSLSSLQDRVSQLQKEQIPFAIVWNKQDIVPHFVIPESLHDVPNIKISCQTKEGFENLFQILQTTLYKTSLEEGQVFVNQRQANLLTYLQETLTQAISLINEGGEDNMELISLSLQNGLKMIGEIDGSDIRENILDSIFSNFCVGK